MKIVAGQFRGRRLSVPHNQDIRPTSDKIRGALFNMLQAREALEGVRVLDAFCGTGALGLEALSRGAQHCCFMDKSRVSLDLAQENAKKLEILQCCDFILKDSAQIGMKSDDFLPYNLVFLDPPYDKGLISPVLAALHAGHWLDFGAWVVCETEKYFSFNMLDGYVFVHEKTYGDTKILLLHYPITPA